MQDAVLELYCQAARLTNRLFGDNVASSVIMTEKEMQSLASEAYHFLVDTLQVIMGPLQTTKLHRLAFHLLKELLGRGNLWEGDTSENESLHRLCKRMYLRSNKRGPSIMLQMMRCSELQDQVLKELPAHNRADRDDALPTGLAGPAVESDGLFLSLEGDAEGGRYVGEDDEEVVDDDGDDAAAYLLSPTPDLQRSVSGKRHAVSSLAVGAMEALGAALGAVGESVLTVAPAVAFHARFEWKARSQVQRGRATKSFHDAPWFDVVRYEDAAGVLCWGEMCLVVRAVNGARRDVVVVRRLRQVGPRTGCVLTRFGCVRLAWEYGSTAAEWPLLEAVPVARLRRLEHMVCDWEDLVSRRGPLAMPSTTPDTSEERRLARFFTNAFYPWTSRDLHPRL